MIKKIGANLHYAPRPEIFSPQPAKKGELRAFQKICSTRDAKHSGSGPPSWGIHWATKRNVCDAVPLPNRRDCSPHTSPKLRESETNSIDAGDKSPRTCHWRIHSALPLETPFRERHVYGQTAFAVARDMRVAAPAEIMKIDDEIKGRTLTHLSLTNEMREAWINKNRLQTRWAAISARRKKIVRNVTREKKSSQYVANTYRVS